MKTHAVLDAYVALASSYLKLTHEKRSKETSLEENASDLGIEECFSTLRFTHSAMFLKYIINFGTGKLEVYKHF